MRNLWKQIKQYHAYLKNFEWSSTSLPVDSEQKIIVNIHLQVH